MTPKPAADIVRAVEAIVGRSGETIALNDACGVCVPSVWVPCGPPDRRVVLSFSNLRGLDIHADAKEEDVLLLRAELDRDHDAPIHAGE